MTAGTPQLAVCCGFFSSRMNSGHWPSESEVEGQALEGAKVGSFREEFSSQGRAEAYPGAVSSAQVKGAGYSSAQR